MQGEICETSCTKQLQSEVLITVDKQKHKLETMIKTKTQIKTS